MEHKIRNFFLNNKTNDILFEYDLLSILLDKKILNFEDLKFNKCLKYIKVNNVQFDIVKKKYLFEETLEIKKIKSKNNFITELILTKEPKIMEIYYETNNIKYEKIKKPEILKDLQDTYLLNFHSLILNYKKPMDL